MARDIRCDLGSKLFPNVSEHEQSTPEKAGTKFSCGS